MSLLTKKQEILKEAMDKIDHFVPMVMTGDLTKEDIEKLLSSSLDRYAQAILKEVEGMAHAHCGKKDCLQGQCINRSIKKEFAKYISSIINESISK